MDGPRIAALLAGMIPLQVPAADGWRGRQPRESSAEQGASKPRDEAARVGPAGLSPLFAAVLDPAGGAQLRLTVGQVDLARRLDALAGEVIRAWSTRGLDATPTPGGRLAGASGRLRALVVHHAESMVLEGILTPEQAQSWRKAAGRKAGPPLAGRDPGEPPSGREATATVTELIDILRSAADALGPDLGLWGTINRSPADQPPHPGGAEPGLSGSRRDLAGRLSALTAEIARGWLTRGLGQAPPPTRAVLARRVREMDPVCEGLFAHAEAIATRAILTTTQVDRGLVVLWNQRGLDALRDRRLADRLGLSQWQREAVITLLDDKDSVQDDPSWGPGPPTEGPSGGPDDPDRWNALGRRDFLDGQVWETLRATQRRELRRIFGAAEKPARRP